MPFLPPVQLDNKKYPTPTDSEQMLAELNNDSLTTSYRQHSTHKCKQFVALVHPPFNELHRVHRRHHVPHAVTGGYHTPVNSTVQLVYRHVRFGRHNETVRVLVVAPQVSYMHNDRHVTTAVQSNSTFSGCDSGTEKQTQLPIHFYIPGK